MPNDRVELPSRAAALERIGRVTRVTRELCRPLEVEDHVVQTMPDVSPPKWHLGHTAWFFEKVVLEAFEPGYRPHHALYEFLFNSYYQSLGARVARPERGYLSRPPLPEVHAYRREVHGRLGQLVDTAKPPVWAEIWPLIEIGLNHEQQHQELLVTDIKHILASNPLRPAYRPERGTRQEERAGVGEVRFRRLEGGLHRIGWSEPGFAYDNERPAHRVFLEDFALAERCVTCGEYRAFIEAGGYGDFRHWLDDGWQWVQAQRIEAPLYWERRDGQWWIQTIDGARAIDPAEPVCHVSFFEADAYARWRGKRLPTEAEWEVAAERLAAEAAPDAALLDDGRLHPRPVRAGSDLLGNVWEWTGSAYRPYPGYRSFAGPLGEYNAKFMSGQMVLRGGSCATARDHLRRSYRNFFQPEKRWQFTGIRLADD